MRSLISPHLTLTRLARRAAARRAAVASSQTRVPCRVWAQTAVAASAVALAGPATAQQSVIPRGAEFRVNTVTAGSQSQPSVAVDAVGNFVVVWTGSNSGIFAQRYAASGAPIGIEIQVSTTPSGNYRYPSVALDADGDFVVIWQYSVRDGETSDIFARRYMASGLAAGPQFLVNTYTNDNQFQASIAIGQHGDFIVAWESNLQDGSSFGVYAQRYAASGARVGAEFRVNTVTAGTQWLPSVDIDPAGNFVIAWSGFAPDGSVSNVYAQRYKATGGPVGEEFRVNTYTTGGQDFPSVAYDADGDFVVVWLGVGEGDNSGIYGQRYSATGARIGEEFRVNTYTAGTQTSHSVDMDADGDFVVVWTSYGQDGSESGVYAQRYAPSGIPIGAEFRVNTYTTLSQRDPSVALDADGDVVVVWASLEQDGSGDGVYGQRYGLAAVASEPVPATAFTLVLTPNPIGSDGATVRYHLPEPAHVRLAVYDIRGREVAVVLDQEERAGPHEVPFRAGRLAPGVYTVRLTTGTSTVARRVTVSR